MEKETKKKDGRYQVVARIGGKQRFFGSRISREDAEEQRDEAKRVWEEMQTQSPQELPPDVVIPSYREGTLAHFVYKVWWPRTRPGIQPTTKAFYTELLEYHILPPLGHLDLDAIGFEEVELMQASAINQQIGGPLGKKRKRECVMLLRTILTLYANIESGKSNRHVRSDWKLSKPPKKPGKKLRPGIGMPFSEAVLAKTHGSWLEGPCRMALFLTCRRGEICGFKWSAVDRMAMEITVREQRHELLEPGALPKGGKIRVIPINNEILAWIDRCGDKESVFVFTEPDPKRGFEVRRPIRPNNLTEASVHLCTGLGYPELTLHDMRACSASNLAQLGVPLNIIMEIAGWEQVETLLRYLRSNDAAKREAMDKLSDAHTG